MNFASIYFMILSKTETQFSGFKSIPIFRDGPDEKPNQGFFAQPESPEVFS